MRLLYMTEAGIFCFTRDLSVNELPPYAILSHTWGLDHEEVIFTDIEAQSVSARNKAGYKKLLFCMRQAKRDGIEHIWVDTCCIDKRNFTELSEAINLMFRWYALARTCYVYMTDVQSKQDETLWEEAFRKSRWFTRSWTLQELLAPKSVEFYTHGEQHIGSRDQHAALISNITGIEVEALQGSPLSSFDVPQRFGWSRGRQAKKPEDEIYCLLGIFKVSMPLIYAEGKDNALRRLRREISDREKDDMGRPVEKKTTFNSESQRRTSTGDVALGVPATSDTLQNIKRRQMILKHLQFAAADSRRSTIEHALANTCNWILEHRMFVEWYQASVSSFLWIKGHPGVGKSTIMKFIDYRIAQRLEGTTSVSISFYFSARGDYLEKSVVGMYRSFIVQLIRAVPLLDRTLDELRFGLKSPPEADFFGDAPLSVLKEIFMALMTASWPIKIYILIDALDETDEEEVLDMVYFLIEIGVLASEKGSTLYTCFASRHYPTLNIPTKLQLVVEHEYGHTDDLVSYVDNKLHISHVKQVEEIKRDILQKANGIFIWVVLVVGILNRDFRRGNILLVEKKLQQIPGKMSNLIEEIARHEDTDLETFLLCLQWVLFSHRPLTLEEFYFAMLAGHSDTEDHNLQRSPALVSSEMMETFMLNSSKGLAELTKSTQPTVQFIHKSVRDFLIEHGGLKAITQSVEHSTVAAGHEALKRCCRRALVSGNLAACGLDITHSWELSEDQRARRKALVTDWPFLEYAATFVLRHAEHASGTTSQKTFCEDFPVALWCDIAIAIDWPEWRGDSYESPDERGKRPAEDSCKLRLLFVSLAQHYQGLMQACIEADAQILFRKDKTGKTALLWAALDDQPDMVQLLLDAGADSRIQDMYGHTALHFGREFGMETLQVLLTAHPDLNAKDDLGRAPVHVLAGLDRADKLKVLLQAGCKVNAIDSQNRTALHYAIEYGQLDCVKALLEAGINVNSPSKRGCVALHIAAAGNLVKTMEALLDAGAEVSAATIHGNTALHIAAQYSSLDAFALLLKRGAVLDTECMDNGNVTDLASTCGSTASIDPSATLPQLRFELADDESESVRSDTVTIEGHLQGDDLGSHSVDMDAVKSLMKGRKSFLEEYDRPVLGGRLTYI